MFWKKNKKTKKQEPTREELIQQAKANAKAARENIGEETLDRIAAAMQKKEQSELEKAKNRIREADQEKVVDNLRWMLEDRKK